MKLCLISDIHGDLTYLQACAGVMQDADAVLLCGDITHFGGRREAASILDEVSIYSDSIFGVIGNCDTREVAEELTARGINLHASGRVFAGVPFFGMEGSLSGPASTPTTYSEHQLESFLRSGRKTVENLGGAVSNSILVCHTPPHGGATDRVMQIKHIGSTSLRRFIESEKPAACFCGHAHEARAVDTIGATRVINPGPFRQGSYAVVDITIPNDGEPPVVDVHLHSADPWK
jgi:uncharacterized protein